MTSSLRERVQSLLRGTSLKSRLFKGGLWLSMGSGTDQLLRFGRNILLARILAPEAFGLMALVYSVNALLESFTQIGIKESVIQSSRGNDSKYLNVAWFLAVTRSLAIYSIGFFAAPYFASFYHTPSLTQLTRVSLLYILFNGSMSIRAYTALKNMQYRKWTMAFHLGGICGVLVSIGLSFYLESVWALVIGYVCEAAFRFLLSYIVCPHKPAFDFDRNAVRSIVKFSKGMFGLPIFYFLFMRADVFVIGKLCSKDELGLYSMASSLAQMPMVLTGMVLDPMVLPLFSKFKDDHSKLCSLLVRLVYLTSSLLLPLLLIVALYNKTILTFLYGDKYSVVAIPFTLLFLGTVVRVNSQPLAALYLALGRPELQRRFVVIRALTMLALILPMTMAFSLVGAASCGIIATIFPYYLQLSRTRRTINLNIGSYLLTPFRSMYTLIPIPIIWAVSALIGTTNQLAQMLLIVASAAVAYILLGHNMARSKEGVLA